MNAHSPVYHHRPIICAFCWSPKRRAENMHVREFHTFGICSERYKKHTHNHSKMPPRKTSTRIMFFLKSVGFSLLCMSLNVIAYVHFPFYMLPTHIYTNPSTHIYGVCENVRTSAGATTGHWEAIRKVNNMTTYHNPLRACMQQKYRIYARRLAIYHI